ncbi:MAG: hypothetical protein SVO26_01000 [Chloroflexota bacterium]|nr:hypothetical protein [Chloroflexota bacterium]
MPPLEVWEKVFLDDAEEMRSTHLKVGCMICHRGDSSTMDKSAAHEGLIIDPSETSCNTCHSEIAHNNESNLHTTLSGFENALLTRGANLAAGSPASEAFKNHCQTCHTTCGQCHVSKPDAMGGGLVSGHEFKNPPSMKNNCVACHGSRVGAEYLGTNTGVPGDLHWTKNGMSCSDCHRTEIHGAGEVATNRYHTSSQVECIDCHEAVLDKSVSNAHHRLHTEILSCQVCHSVDYKGCYNCHVEVSEQGTCYFTSDPSVMQFEVGFNPITSPERPYKYVVLRHVPTNPDLFASYGANLLPNFNALPTWKYATPHNIQLKTPQNDGCNYCHGQEQLFLLPSDVTPQELEANKSVIVYELPGMGE